MAWRETRGAGRHFAYLAACVSLGVAALVAVAGLGGSVERTVAGSARALMGGDVEVRSTQPLSAAAETALRDTAGPAVDRASVMELVGMARAGERSQLVELKAVSPGYPLHGAPVTDPPGPLASLLGEGRVLVHESLLLRLGLAVGDRMRIGDAEVTVSGRIVVEPDRTAGVFSLGPRVLVTAGDLARTGLVQPGSRVRYRTLLRLAPGGDAQDLRDRLAAALPDPALRITTFRQAQPGLRRFWDQLTTYLGLAGLVALLVGGIGVAVSVGAFVRGKLATIAILKCLGAEWRRILAVYLVQTGALGLAGSLAGAALGAALVPILARLAGTLMPLPLTPSIAPGAVLRGLAMGLGVTVLAALWPLLEVRRVGAAFILRRDTEPRRPAARERLVALPIAAGLAALAFWQAGSLKVGALFVGGFAGGLLLLWGAARLALRLARRVPRGRGPLAWRQGLANLHRPGSRAGAILVTLGLAVMLVMAVAILEANLRGDLTTARAQRAPAFFFIDLQPDQVDDFGRIVRETSGAAPTLIPVVRSRLAAVKGVPVEADRGRRDEQWHLTRQYVLTWAAAPPGDNVVVAGRWWTAEEARREPLISVEEEIAKSLGVGLGDALTFDVLGVPVTARIAEPPACRLAHVLRELLRDLLAGRAGRRARDLHRHRARESRRRGAGAVAGDVGAPQRDGHPGSRGAGARDRHGGPDRVRGAPGRRRHAPGKPGGDGGRARRHAGGAALPVRDPEGGGRHARGHRAHVRRGVRAPRRGRRPRRHRAGRRPRRRRGALRARGAVGVAARHPGRGRAPVRRRGRRRGLPRQLPPPRARAAGRPPRRVKLLSS